MPDVPSTAPVAPSGLSRIYDPRTGNILVVHAQQIPDMLRQGYSLFDDERYGVAAFNESTQRWDTGATVLGRDYISTLNNAGGLVRPVDVNQAFDMNEANSAADREAQMGGGLGQLATGVASGVQSLADMASAAAFTLASPGEAGRRIIQGENLPTLTGAGEFVAPGFMDNLEALQTENPGSDLFGSAVGLAIPSIAALPAGATVGAGAVARMGLSGAAALATRTAVTAGTEALINGVENVVLDTALRMRADPNYAAETITSTFGTGAMWGGGISLAFQAFGGLGGALARAAGRIRGRNTGARAIVGDIEQFVEDYERADMTNVVDRAAALQRARMGLGPTESPGVLYQLGENIGRTPIEEQLAVQEPRFAREAIQRRERDALETQLLDEFRTLLDDAQSMRRQIWGDDPNVGIRNIQETSAYRTVADDYFQGSGLGRAPAENFIASSRENLARIADSMEQAAKASLTETPRAVRSAISRIRASVGKFDEVLERMKAEADWEARRIEDPSIGRFRDPVDLSDARLLDDLYADVSKVQDTLYSTSRQLGQPSPFFHILTDAERAVHTGILRNPKVVGEGLSNFRLNLDSVNELVRDPYDTIVSEIGQINPQTGAASIDSAKFAALVREFGDPAKAVSAYENIIQAVHKLQRGGAVARGAFRRGAENISPTVNRLRAATAEDILEEASRNPTPVVSTLRDLSRRQREMRAAGTMFSGENQTSAIGNLVTTGIAGVGAGTSFALLGAMGLPTAMAGSAAMATALGMFRIFRPAQYLHLKTTIRHAGIIQHITDVATRRTEAMRGLTRSLTAGSLSRGRVGIAAMANTWSGHLNTREEREKAFDDISGFVLQVAADQDLRQGLVAARIQGIADVDPQLALSLADSMNRSMDYLAYHVPQTGIPFMRGSEMRPSMAEIESFMQRVQALDDPYILVDQIAAGMVNPDAIDAVRNVYPSTYSDIMEGVMEAVANVETPISYQHRLQISSVVGPHMEPTLDPTFVMSMQVHGAETTQQSQIAGSNFNGAQVDYARQNTTLTQRLEDN